MTAPTAKRTSVYTPKYLSREARDTARRDNQQRRKLGERTARPRNVIWHLEVHQNPAAVQLVVEWQEGDGNYLQTVAI